MKSVQLLPLVGSSEVEIDGYARKGEGSALPFERGLVYAIPLCCANVTVFPTL